MRTGEKLNVVMLPTKKASDLSINKSKFNKMRRGLNYMTSQNAFISNQHIYAVMPGDINDGDSYFDADVFDEIYKCGSKKRNDETGWPFKNRIKIVASSDVEATPFCLFNSAFKDAYCLAHNNEKSIKEIELEWEDNQCVGCKSKQPINNGLHSITEFADAMYLKTEVYHVKCTKPLYNIPKTRTDHTVIVHQIKTYSSLTVSKLLDEEAMKFYKNHHGVLDSANMQTVAKFIEQVKNII